MYIYIIYRKADVIEIDLNDPYAKYKENAIHYISLRYGRKVKLVEVLPDGNCLYHCLFHFYKKHNLKGFDDTPQIKSTIELKKYLIEYFFFIVLYIFDILTQFLRYAWDHKDLSINCGNNQRQNCETFFSSMRATYNLPKDIEVGEIIKRNDLWANDMIGRIFCQVFQIEIYSITSGIKIDEFKWQGRDNKINLENSPYDRSKYPPLPTEFLICLNNIHYNYVEDID